MFWTIRGNDFQPFVPIKLDARTPKLDVALTLTEWIILLNLTNSGYIVPVNGWR